MTTKRVLSPATGPSNQAQLRFNEESCSDKVSETGFDYFGGTSALLGALDAAVLVPKFRPILVVNASGAIQYVSLSDDPAMAAPIGGATGIPIAADGGSIVLSSGENTYIRASNANVFGYLASDNVLPDGM